ncbi:M28 family peptidase [bacterium]|nr:M28 family peptidase [bacterium]
MQKRSTLFFICLFGLNLAWGQSNIDKALKSITAEELKNHVYFLADDAMNGRDTPSAELDSAAAYISQQFMAGGLTAPQGSYYQHFNVLRSKLGKGNGISLINDGTVTAYKIKKDFVPLAVSKNGIIEETAVIFAGYGITAPEYNYDDYAEIDVQNKIVLIFTGEPQAKDTSSIFSGAQNSDYARLRVKVENALEHGAIGLLLISNPHRNFRRPPNSWPSLMRNAPVNAVPLKRETIKGGSLAAMQLGKKLGKALLEGSGQTLVELFDNIDSDLQPRSFELSGIKVTMETRLDIEKNVTQNVWAYLEGSDPLLKDELVIIGGHYDHVGVQKGEIYNGADDNASGTSGVIELAEAFAMLDQPPKRSMLFMTYSGEEKGLFGSYHYTDNPLMPMENTAAMFCLDMISRNDTNAVVIIGDKCSETLTANCDNANEIIGMDMTKTSDWFLQSDHYPFYKKGVPVLFFNCGDTEDLHQPTDDCEKIIPEKMERITRLIFLTALKTANSVDRPDYIKFR